LELINKEDLSVKKGGTAEVTFRPFVEREVFSFFEDKSRSNKDEEEKNNE